MEIVDSSGNRDVAVSIAVASTIIYAVLLFMGSIFFFFLGSKATVFLAQRNRVGFCLLFGFSLIPTILFIGIIGPWICVTYNSLSGTVVFLIAPGMLLFLLILSWCALRSETTITSDGTIDLGGL
ncbi:hypothetical protein LSM04_007271 [Trypanosoma melophagium]|uniref:uncharacterized protein n=1 Tax=Trypanosoma melophagium TaxID=715481 RepID=UPI00351A6921|nr:hypothetical protein LSM04_007271 [Trypanosoma melophagium]